MQPIEKVRRVFTFQKVEEFEGMIAIEGILFLKPEMIEQKRIFKSGQMEPGWTVTVRTVDEIEVLWTGRSVDTAIVVSAQWLAGHQAKTTLTQIEQDEAGENIKNYLIDDWLADRI